MSNSWKDKELPINRRQLLIGTIIFIIVLFSSCFWFATTTYAAPKEPYLIVDLSDQMVYRIVNGEVVWSRLVSTGADGTETPTGTYKVHTKLPIRTMQGCNKTECWVVPNVKWVMYFDNRGDALHGTYWHNGFGKIRISHGCVNMREIDAEWLYNRTPIGTTVIVRY